MVYLTGATLHSLRTASFTFTSSIPLTITPGQAAIIDMGPWSGKAGYQHMSAVGQEARLNDDGVRTWTISSAHVSGPTTEFTVTLALKKHGSITPRLFGVAQTAAERGSTALSATPYEFTQNLIGVGLPLVGVGGGFVLSPKSTSLVWFAGGIGITPFLSMLSAAMEDRSAQTFDITLIVSTREPATIIKLIQRSVSSARAPSHVHLRVILFSTRLRLVDTPEKEHSEEDTIMLRHAGIQEFEQHQGRVALDGIKQLQLDFEGRETFVCGPQLFEKAILEALAQLNVDIAEVKKESFNY
jgi:NAD(P)H-flavin reductase